MAKHAKTPENDPTSRRHAHASVSSASSPVNQLDPESVAEAYQAAHPKATPGLKVFGVVSILAGLVLLPNAITGFLAMGRVFRDHALSDYSVFSKVFYVVLVTSLVITLVAAVILGVRLLLNKRRRARHIAEALIVLIVVNMLCRLMLFGIEWQLGLDLIAGVMLVAMLTYIDPTLTEERELTRKLRDLETREEAEDGTLGLDETGHGYIRLDFFNLFWLFVIGCVFGDLIETVYHIAVVDPGHFENRTGMLWGPFSPIYGFGAVLMTLALNRFYKAPWWVIFLVSAVIGGAFEYFVSWFLQFAFGVVAWDYTGTFLNIGGRTNFMFMCMWGFLGLVWIKLLLPWILRLVNRIPWQWRYSITTVCAVFMLFDGFMTLATLNCWYERMAGLTPDNALAQYCANHFDNAFMEHRFQSMSIDPAMSTRA